MAGKLQTAVRPKPVVRSALIQRLQFSKILSLPESEFAKLIAEIENDPTFQKLIYPPDSGIRALSKRRYPHTRLAKSFYEAKDELFAESKSADVEKLLEQHQEIVALIKRIGQDAFEKFFLYKEGAESAEEIAGACGIAQEDVRRIQNLVNELSVQSEFFHPTAITSGAVHYVPIAKIEMEEESGGDFIISYLAPHLSQGRYVLHPERVQEIKKILDREEKKKLTQLIKKIEWVNLRQDTLQKILNEMLETQELYLRQNDPEKLLPISQRELAKRLSVAPSTVNRAIFGRSVILPWGEEKPLKELFLKRKSAIQNKLSEILDGLSADRRGKITDDQLKIMLAQRYRLRISRRSVNLYRRELAPG